MIVVKLRVQVSNSMELREAINRLQDDLYDYENKINKEDFLNLNMEDRKGKYHLKVTKE